MVTGFNAYAFDGCTTSGSIGMASPADAASLVSLGAGFGSMSFTLDDTLRFMDRGLGGSLNHAEFRIDLISQLITPPPPRPPAPEPPPSNKVSEPGPFGLVALAGLGLAVSRRRAATRKR